MLSVVRDAHNDFDEHWTLGNFWKKDLSDYFALSMLILINPLFLDTFVISNVQYN